MLKRDIEDVLMLVIQRRVYERGWCHGDLERALYGAVFGRLDEGMEHYGVELTTDNGRDALWDAWEEAIDGLQYLIQAYLEGGLGDLTLVNAQSGLMLGIYKAWKEKEARHRTTETDRTKQPKGTTEDDADLRGAEDPL